jgi:lipopolysaccharide transport system ATP-binding protein
MPDPVIRAESVSKVFAISHQRAPKYLALRDLITQGAKRLLGRAPGDEETETFHALRDVSFSVEPGDRIGVIGRNGAGKSTLLKILSRITEPTSGRIRIRGRVAALLEVGTGFHAELTGRENIYLNGALLGMRRAEIRAKFDEIVAFAEVERFLDTPVKHYSNGMYVRLGFAVAAHLEPEILVVDEVLSVGDAQFQKRCLGKMEDVSRQEGRTIVFVSHNTGVVSQLCNKALLLDRGRVIADGNADAVLRHYVNQLNDTTAAIGKPSVPGHNQFILAQMTDAAGNKRTEFRLDEELLVATELFLDDFSQDLELVMQLIDRHKNPVFTIHEKLSGHHALSGKMVRLNVSIPPAFITPGHYSWVMYLNTPGAARFDLQHDLQDDVLPFRVLDSGSDFSRHEGQNYGPVFARYSVQRLT